MTSAPPEPAPTPPVEVPAVLAPAVARFERGDFQGATADLRALLATAPPDDVARGARDLLARMTPDPWALRIGILAAAILALLVAIYVV